MLEVKKMKIILLGILGILTLAASLFFLEESYTEAFLHGGGSINTTVKEAYHDLGFDLYHNNKLISKENYTYTTHNNVDTNELGEYTVTYDISYHLRKFHLERKIHVVDDIKPVIVANLDKIERDFCTKKDKSKLTYEAVDNYDGTLTDKVMKEEKDNDIVLTVTDVAGNTGILNIPIDYGKKPSNVIKLNGGSTVYVKLNGSYKEQGAGYYDGCGKKIDDKVKISGSVNTKKTGNYTITYTTNDGATKKRKVVVYKESQSVISGSGNGKVLYLTFDDGPGKYTQKILNTLAKYNVKATFFVTNQFPGYVHLIKNEYNAGHAIAVHSYTHNYNIYKSVDAYVKDFNKMNDLIAKYTGSKSRIFRFPGGSSNTVSRNYAKGVVKKIANKMTSDGYKYFDWDVSSGDAAGAGRSKIYSNVVNGAKSCKTCIILMHDIKATTANELDNILKTLTSKGYRFGTLSSSSPTVHHKIAN